MSEIFQPLLDAAAACAAAGAKGKAAANYQAILNADPNHSFALAALGSLRLEEGRYVEADLLLNRSVRRLPAGETLAPEIRANAALAARMVGVAAQAAGRHVEAELALTRALELTPGDPVAQFHLATQSAPEIAEPLYRQAAAAMSDQPGPVINLGLLLQQHGRRAEAETQFRDAVRRAPDLPEAHMNLAFLLLGDGRLAEGWAEYEWRMRWLNYQPPVADRPAWDGGAAPGKTLLLWAEQGLGDTIMMARFIPQVAAQAGRVVVQVQPTLVALLRRQNWPVEVVAWDAPVPEHDLQASLMSLPLLLGAALDDLPGRGGYLTAAATPPAPIPTEGLRVGVVWSGNKAHPAYHRAMPCSALTRLANLPGLRLVSLQVGEAAAELAHQPWAGQVVDLAPALADLDAAAAAIAALDQVVTIDTSIAHLAGALGKPTLLLLSPAHCWRWLADKRTSSPWYDSVRIVRAQRVSHWRDALLEAAAILSPACSSEEAGR